MRSGACILSTLCLATAAVAAPSHWVVERFGTQEGLPSNSVLDMVEGSDGYLWVATLGSLARFDGRRFVVLDSGNTPGLEANRFVGVSNDRSGDLLALAESGEFYRCHAGAFRREPSEGNLVWFRVDAAGTIWGLRSASPREPVRLVHVVNGAAREDPRRVLRTSVLEADDDGRIWFVTPDGGITSTDAAPGAPPVGRVGPGFSRPIRDASSGRVLFARDVGTRIVLAAADGTVRASLPAREGVVPGFVDSRGAVWAATPQGAVMFAAGGDEPALVVPVKSPGPFYEDRSGTVWIGSVADGLWRVKAALAQVVVGSGALGAVPSAIYAGDDGRIFVDDGRRTVAIEGDRIAADTPSWTGHAIPLGAGVVVTLAPGAIRIERAGRAIATLEGPFGLGSPIIDLGRPARIWLRGGPVVTRVDLSDPERPRVEERIDLPVVPTGGLADREGRLWLFAPQGLARVVDGKFEMLAGAPGVPRAAARTAWEDRTGTVWFGTYGAGLVRFRDGRFQSIDESRGLAENFVSAILGDDAGDLWLSGNRGIHRVSIAALDAALDGKAERVLAVTYAAGAGIPEPEASGGSAARSADGRLWFPVYSGVVVIDPMQVLAVTRAPTVWIERVLDEGIPVPTDGGVASLPAGHRRFSVEFTGIDLPGTQSVSHRFRLDGVDEVFRLDDGRRTAVYTHVPPGRHAFQVEASLDGATWHPARNPLTIVVPYRFYETKLFLAAVVVVLVLGGFWAVRWRTRELARRERELQRVVAERTKALSEAKAQVEDQAERLLALDQAKSRFFANVSHEFRTPLTLVLGPLDDLMDGMHGELSAEAREPVELASRSAKRVLRLVEQLLDTARIESGALKLRSRESDLGAFVRDTARALVPMAERKRIALTVPEPAAPIPAWFDPEQLEKVLVNLLGNALKFTPEGGRVDVSVASDGAFATVRVADDGPGIAADDLPRVFDRFHRGIAAATREQPGTGIGLSLAKELVELHRGTIGVESREGEGAAFWFRLPLGRAHLDDAEIASPAPPPPPREMLADEIRVEAAPEAPVTGEEAMVLVVDDHPDVRAWIRSRLERRYRVVEAANGRRALELAREDVPDCVVADVTMPEMDGFAMLEAMRADASLDFVPVLLLTAKASLDSRVSGLGLGADDYLVKPLDGRELEARVDNVIASRRRLRARFSVASEAVAVDLDSDRATFLARLRAAITERIGDDDFDPDALAKALGQSRRTLFRRVEEATGLSPMEFLWKVRIDTAARLLDEKAGSVGEIAYGVGFKAVSHFARKFRAAYGMSPSEYRSRKGRDG